MICWSYQCIRESDTAEDIPWEEVIKKEARGINDYDLGEVQNILDQYALTQKGIVDRKWFEIPKELAQAFDGNKLIFRVSETEAKDMYLRDEPAVCGASNIIKKNGQSSWS